MGLLGMADKIHPVSEYSFGPSMDLAISQNSSSREVPVPPTDPSSSAALSDTSPLSEEELVSYIEANVDTELGNYLGEAEIPADLMRYINIVDYWKVRFQAFYLFHMT